MFSHTIVWENTLVILGDFGLFARLVWLVLGAIISKCYNQTVRVIPAINALDLAAAKRQAAIIKSFLLRGSWLHLDVSDGVFSAVKNWGEAAEFKDLKLGFYKTEVHLMVENPEDLAEVWLKTLQKRGSSAMSSPNLIGGSTFLDSPAKRGNDRKVSNDRKAPEDDKRARIIAHLEAIRNSSHILDLCQEYGAELMIAINPETLVENLIPYFHNIKYFQILAVSPGQSGQKFQKAVLEKIRFLRERAPDVIIEVDGGVNPETAVQAKEAGADIVVSASYIMNAKSPQEAYRSLLDQ